MKTSLMSLLLACTTTLLQPALGQVPDTIVVSLMEQYNVPGLALAVVDGASIETHAWGFADAGSTTSVTAHTPFRIASVSKVFVAATVLTEVANGEINLETDVTYLIPNTGRFTGPIPLRDLLTHTAGFDERYIGYAARSADDMIRLEEYLQNRMPSRGWPVGEQISYSNHGMSLAALAVERVRGRSFDEIANEAVFERLGMYSTSFLKRGTNLPTGTADPLSCSAEGCKMIEHLFSNAYPAGLAFSTASDMSRFISAILNASEDNSPLVELIPARFSHDKRLDGMSYGFFNQRHNGVRFLSHAGSVPGYWSLLMVSPEAGVGFFFVANGGRSEFGERFRDELLFSLLGENRTSPPVQAVSENPETRAGVYQSTRFSHETIERFPQVFRESITLVADADTLKMVAGGKIRKYIQTGTALYENLDGSDRISFGIRRGEPRLFRTSFVYGAGVPVAYEKRPWFLAPGFLNEYVSWLMAAPLLMLLTLWPLIALLALLFRKRAGRGKHPQAFISLITSLATTATFLLFGLFGFRFIGQSNRMLESGELFFGMPEELLSLAWIPSAHAALTVTLLAALVFAWKNSWWEGTRRTLFSILMAALSLQVAFLIQWNYLPPAW